jgi:hypothetical protein
MRKVLVALCSVVLVMGSVAPMEIVRADGSAYEEDGDLIQNPFGDRFEPETETQPEEPTVTDVVSATKDINIRVQPQDVVSASGKTVRLYTAAESRTGSTLSYQWQISKDDGATWTNSSASGAKTNSMQFSMSKTLDGRIARCILTDAKGNTLTTAAAKIIMGTPDSITITKQPTAIKANTNEYAYASVDATGNALMFRWQMSSDNGKTWVSSTAKSASAKNFYFKMGKSYVGKKVRCLITDANLNTKTTEAVTISNGNAPAYVCANPANTLAKVGDSVPFTVVAGGSGVSYQWEISKDGGVTWSNSTAAGSKTNTMSFTMSKTLDGRMVRCKITDNAGGYMYSSPAKVILNK